MKWIPRFPVIDADLNGIRRPSRMENDRSGGEVPLSP